jgi:hypothetical protein
MGKTCAWCYKPTSLPEIFAADVPILDWMEERITKYCDDNEIDRDALWGEDSDWDELNLDENFEMELIAYDELIATVSRKTVCQECLQEYDKLWKKYYMTSDLDDEDDDFELEIDDLK